MTLDLDTLVLSSGAHASPSDGVSLMEAVSDLAGEPWSNSPSCTSPVIAAYARSLALVGIGFLSLAVGSILPSFFGMYPDEYPVLFLLLGFAVGALGSLLTGVALSRSPGWLRLSALAMFVGFALLILSTAGGTPVISEVYFVLFALSFAAIGVVALRAAPRQADA